MKDTIINYEDNIVKKTFNKQQFDFFIIELYSLKQLNHINVIKMLDYSFLEISLEKYDNNCYNDISKFDYGHLNDFIYQVSSGLSYIHSRDIIHCDIKNSNILHKGLYRFVICDFDSSILKSNYRNHYVKCTEGYRPPEDGEKCIIDYKFDYWSFGICILEILYGKAIWHQPQKILYFLDFNKKYKLNKDDEEFIQSFKESKYYDTVKNLCCWTPKYRKLPHNFDYPQKISSNRNKEEYIDFIMDKYPNGDIELIKDLIECIYFEKDCKIDEDTHKYKDIYHCILDTYKIY